MNTRFNILIAFLLSCGTVNLRAWAGGVDYNRRSLELGWWLAVSIIVGMFAVCGVLTFNDRK